MNNCREHFSTNQDVRIGITCYNISTPQKYWTCLYIIFQIDPTFYQFSQVSSNIPCWLLCLGSTKGGTFVSEQLFFFFFFFLKDFIYLFLERGEEREKESEKSMSEKHWSVASRMHHDRGPNPQPRHVPWLGIKLVTFGFLGRCPTSWGTQSGPGSFLVRLGLWLCLGLVLVTSQGQSPGGTLPPV